MKTIKTMFDGIPGCRGVPAGRLAEELAKIPADKRERVVCRHGRGMFDGYTLCLYPSRAAAVAAVEKERERAGAPWRLSLAVKP